MLLEGSNFTHKAQEAILKAQTFAQKRKQSQVDALHLLYALLNQEESIVLVLLSKLGVNIEELRKEAEKAINAIPIIAASGAAGKVYLTQDMAQVLEKANSEAMEMGDEFISVEHLFLSLLSSNTKAKEILSKFTFIKPLSKGDEQELETSRLDYETVLKILSQIRGNEKITDPEPEAKYQVIEKYTRNLTDMAKGGKLDPIIGRENEIRRLMQILCRRTKNNPALIGEPGVGKTAIVEGLAQKIAKREIPEFLKNKEIIALDLGALIAGTRFRGEFEQRIKAFLREIKKAQGRYFVFIDELHSLVGAGAAEGAVDASNLLKPSLAKGEIRAIGATTLKEYQKYVERDAALERRFQPIYVSENTVEDTIAILRGIKEKYEVHHGVKITDESLVASAKLADKYITDRFLPDKAVDLMDEAASALRLEIESQPLQLDQYAKEIDKLKIEKTALAKEEKSSGRKSTVRDRRLRVIERALADLKEKEKALRGKWIIEKELIDKIKKLRVEIDQSNYEIEIAQRRADLEKMAELKYGKLPQLLKDLRKTEKKLVKIQKKHRLLKEEVTIEDVAIIISRWTGIPATKLLTEEAQKLEEMEKVLTQRVIGQQEAVSAISKAVRRARAGISEENKPLGVFLFLGPTGVGKTETARALAEFLFDDEKAMLRLDMSEYMERHSVSKIIGSPPGYVGYEEGGQLAEKVRRRPYSVVLLDEVEKAHPEVFNILLQVFEDGRLTDAKGRVVSFKNTIIIMTSNIGSEIINKMGPLGFASEKGAPEKESLKERINERLKETFRPEFLNRVDEIIIFNYLSLQDIEKIVELELAKVGKRLKEKDIKMNFSKKAKKLLVDKGFNQELGARPLKREIQKLILDPLAFKIISSEIQDGSNVFVDAVDDKIVFQTPENIIEISKKRKLAKASKR